MKRNMFLRKLSSSYSRLRRYLDFHFSSRWFSKAPVLRSGGIVFNPSLEMLEGRFVLSSDIVVGGLQFRVPTDFASQNGIYSTSSVVDVGFAPGSGTFTPLLQLNGNVSIDTNQGRFSASGSVNAVASGSTVALLSAGITHDGS